MNYFNRQSYYLRCVPGFIKTKCVVFPSPGSDSEDSADGKPLDGGMSSSISAPAPPAGAFIKSKWETVDPEQVSRSFDCLRLLLVSCARHSSSRYHLFLTSSKSN